LQVLVGALHLLSPSPQRIVLSVPGASGASPFDSAIQSHQWEAVQLLAAAGGYLLSHDFLVASQQVARLINPGALHDGGRLGAKAAVSGGGGLARTVQGAVSGVQSYLGRLFDWVSGQAEEREVVLRHQAQQAQQGSSVGSGHGGHGGGGGDGAGSSGDGRRDAKGPAEGVMVLQGTADVQRLLREQIESTAYVLGVSAPEAAALLAEHGWDELAAVQSRLGSTREEGGAGREGATGAGSPASGPAGAPAAPGAGFEGGPAQPGVLGPVGLAAVLGMAQQPGEEAAGKDGEDEGGRCRCPAAFPVGSSGGGSSGGSSHWISPGAAGLAGGSAPGAGAVGHPTSGPADQGEGRGNGAQVATQCIVCYERCGGKGAWRGLPCGHPTCDACWKGILLAQLDTGKCCTPPPP
jgi:hypothetical protein